MKKYISILLFTLGTFLILKAFIKLDKNTNKVVILPPIEERVEKAIPVKNNPTLTPAPKLYNSAPVGPYLESGKVNLRSK